MSMRPLYILPLVLTIFSCKPPAPEAAETATAPPAEATPAPTADVKLSVVRVNSTQQSWNPWQPWDKNPPRKRRALAAIVAPQRVLTTSELAADATFWSSSPPTARASRRHGWSPWTTRRTSPC